MPQGNTENIDLGKVDNLDKLASALDNLVEPVKNISEQMQGREPGASTPIASDVAGLMSALIPAFAELAGISKQVSAELKKVQGSSNDFSGAISQLSKRSIHTNRAAFEKLTTGINKSIDGVTGPMDKLAKSGLESIYNARKAGSETVALLKTLNGAIKLAIATPFGGKGAASVTLANPLLMLADFLIKQIFGQIKAMWDENKKALIGGNAANALMTSALAGNWQYGKSMLLNAQDYSLYRSEMRMRGERNDETVASNLHAMENVGIFGNHLLDAIGAAISRQTMKVTFGMDLSPEFMGLLYRGTRGLKDSPINASTGRFSASGYGAMLSKMSARTIDETGAGISMPEVHSLIESMMKAARGNTMELGEVSRQLGPLLQAIKENKISLQDATQLMASTNRGLSFNDKLYTLAFSNRSLKGDMLTNMWKWNERAYTVQGQPQNLRLAATAALEAYHSIGGTRESKDVMAIFSEFMLSHFGFGGLKDNPKMIDLLTRIANGDKSAQAEAYRLNATAAQELDYQSRTLDAIRNPVEHMRDFMFGQLVNDNDPDSYNKVERQLASGRRAASYSQWKDRGLDDKEAMTMADKDVASQKSDEVSAWKEALTAMFDDPSIATQEFAKELNKATKEIYYNRRMNDSMAGSDLQQ